MATNFLPPPTYADVITIDEVSKKPSFNPEWLNWFLQIAQAVNVGGGPGGTIQHNSLGGLQGGGGTEFFHLTNSVYGVLSVASTGTYTPTLTNVANVSSSTANASQFLRIGATTLVSGMLAATPTALTTSTSLRISIPIASNFTSIFQCAGTAYTDTIVSEGASIQADTTNHVALMKWVNSSTAARNMYYSFCYQVA